MNQENIEELRARLLADEQVRSMIAMRAFEIFQLRGGSPGHEADDWLQAEAEILTFVIDEEIRQSAAQSLFKELASVGRAGPTYDTIEKGMEVFAVIEAEAVLSSEPSARAELARGESSRRKSATPAKTSSREGVAKAASSSKKEGRGLKAPKASDKKAPGKVKLLKKSGKTKQSKNRSAEMEKQK